MPDSQKQTVSASQVAALFNVSRFATRWMLYQHFVAGMPIEADETDRLAWGRALEGVIMQAAAEKMALRIDGNEDQRYIRHGDIPLGCTEDGWCFDPGRGWGVVEAKNVDSLIYRDLWTDTMAPRDVELQVQAQLMVTGYEWAIIAALVGGNHLVLYERTPNAEVQQQIADEAQRFMRQVRGEEAAPEPFGSPLEIPGLDYLYPEVEPGKEIEAGEDFAADVRNYEYARRQRLAFKKVEDELKPRILGRAEDAERVYAPGLAVRIKKSQTAEKTAPPDVTEEAANLVALLNEGHTLQDPEQVAALEELEEALNQPPQVLRKASVRTEISAQDDEQGGEVVGVGQDYLDAHKAMYGGKTNG